MTIVLMTLLAFTGGGDRPPPPEQRPAPVQVTPNQTAPVPLLETHWTLVAVGELTFAPQHEASGPHLVLHADRSAIGSDGCNVFRAAYTADRKALTFGTITGAAIPCGPERLDERFREVLVRTRKWTVEEGTLTLFDADGAALARFEVKFGGL